MLIKFIVIALCPHLYKALRLNSDSGCDFDKAIQSLTPEDYHTFEDVTGVSLTTLIDKTRALDEGDLCNFMLDQTQEAGNVWYHPLNALGLHVLRYLLAHRIADSRRATKGWTTHPAYAAFMRDGIIVKKLENWEQVEVWNETTHIELNHAENELIQLVSGYDNPTCPGTLKTKKIRLQWQQSAIFHDDDDQYQMHQDVYQPTWKMFVFTENVTLENGPFNYVYGSNQATKRKLQWLYDRSKHFVHMVGGENDGATRHINSTAWRLGPDKNKYWCTDSHECLSNSYWSQQRDLMTRYGFQKPSPVEVQGGTMILADTSGLHFRGIGTHGGKRANMAQIVVECSDGRTSKEENLGMGGQIVIRRPWGACLEEHTC